MNNLGPAPNQLFEEPSNTSFATVCGEAVLQSVGSFMATLRMPPDALEEALSTVKLCVAPPQSSYPDYFIVMLSELESHPRILEKELAELWETCPQHIHEQLSCHPVISLGHVTSATPLELKWV